MSYNSTCLFDKMKVFKTLTLLLRLLSPDNIPMSIAMLYMLYIYIFDERINGHYRINLSVTLINCNMSTILSNRTPSDEIQTFLICEYHPLSSRCHYFEKFD